MNHTIRLLIKDMISLKDDTNKYLVHLSDNRIIDTKGWNGWDWTHGAGLYGIWKYYEITGDPTLLQHIEAWFKIQFDRGGTEKNINIMSVFLTLAYVYEKTENQTYRPWLEEWAEWAMHHLPRTEYGGMQHITYVKTNCQQLWDDTLMMTALPLMKIGQLLNRPEYVEEAMKQMLILIQYLFDAQTGIFFHGWQFADADGSVGHNFAEARWARGNSWLTIVISEMRLEILEASDKSPALGAFQVALDHPVTEGSYNEASATAGFAYGILKARRKRFLGDQVGHPETSRTYDNIALDGIRAVLDNVSPEGKLLQTSFGTCMGNTLQFYKDVVKTSMPYGQAMAIMALVEFCQTFHFESS
ncbi:hypothetical protein N0V90_008894 [Kalmusia sp. IMI 367209]|nr:hypothetical protein N0V90_008894 [Kalmusia sp. IMI 367209]